MVIVTTFARPGFLRRALDAGAQFLVSPGSTPTLLSAMTGTGLPFLPGTATVSEVLAVLEAAELPPTFGTDPRRVVAMIAGGRSAVFRAREGAEDRADEGARGQPVPGQVAPGRLERIRERLAEEPYDDVNWN